MQAWGVDVGPFQRSAWLGSDDEPPAVAAWRAAVVARGHRPTRIPAGRPNAGELAEAIGTNASNTQNVTYRLAPADVRQADGHYSAQLQDDVNAGKVADAVTAVLAPIAGVGTAVLDAPRDAIAEAVGIPQKWSPLVALGVVALGGYLIVRTVKR